MNKICFLALIIFFTGQAFALAKPAPKQSTMLMERFEDEDEFETYETKTSEEIYDPFEKVNRKIYAFNDFFDRYFFEHVAKTYRSQVPKNARDCVHNFVTNLTLPISATNSLLQGKVDNSLATFSNFLINSTIGVLGLFDVASQKNITYKPEDFGQTLGYYGFGAGPYLVLPILGPKSTRDFGGWATDLAVNPIGFNAAKIGNKEELIKREYLMIYGATLAIDTRESLIDIIDDIRKDSFDPYATIRSAYLQKRIAEVEN